MIMDTSHIEPFGPIVRRKTWLTNEPAEFAENNTLFRELRHTLGSSEEFEPLGDISEFSPFHDSFLPKYAVIE